CDTTHAWTLAKPAIATGFAELALGVIGIGNFANGRTALGVDETGFARRQSKLGETIFDRHELSRRTGCTGDLRATTRQELHRVDLGCGRNAGQLERIAWTEIV